MRTATPEEIARAAKSLNLAMSCVGKTLKLINETGLLDKGEAVNPSSQLGKMAAGVPKKYSPAEIAKRTARLRKAQKNRAKTQRALRRSNSDYPTG